MKIKVDIEINASNKEVWNIISDIEHSEKIISGINNIDILNKPKDSLVGLKWVETRTMFGKAATETMWITEAEENSYYKTRAESHGAIYTTYLKLSGQEKTTLLSMEFSSEAVSFSGKLMSMIFGGLLKKSMKKLLLKDLTDIKTAVEKE